MSSNPSATAFVGSGETGALINARDWSHTVLGPVEGWPQSLKSVVELV
jgi:hypothetical protein